MSTARSGTQWVIARGEQEATIVEVGGGLRTYRVAGVDVIAGYAADEQCSQGRGQVLMPWPNRIRDGRYAFEGRTFQLALTEPARGNASHGLVRWSTWSLLERSESALTVGYRLHPQPGWDGILDLAITYALTDDGLTVATRATNVGATRVPFGCGFHPFVAIGDTPRSDVTLCFDAREELVVDAARKLPVGRELVAGGLHEFRRARAIGNVHLDSSFTGLARDERGHWHVDVAGLAGRPDVRIWADAAFAWVQVFTDAADDDAPTAGRGVAIEPLTCPADAFNSGDGLVALDPGAQWSGSWGVTTSAVARTSQPRLHAAHQPRPA